MIPHFRHFLLCPIPLSSKPQEHPRESERPFRRKEMKDALILAWKRINLEKVTSVLAFSLLTLFQWIPFVPSFLPSLLSGTQPAYCEMWPLKNIRASVVDRQIMPIPISSLSLSLSLSPSGDFIIRIYFVAVFQSQFKLH